MAVQVLEAVGVHEAMVLRLVVGVATGGDGLANCVVHLAAAVAGMAINTSVLALASQIGFGVKPLNFSCVNNITKMSSPTIMQVAVSSVNCWLKE